MEYLAVGYVLKPQGIKGELKVKPLTDDPSRFQDLKWVFVSDHDKYRKIPVTGVRLQEDIVFLSLDGIPDRSKAEEYRGQYLWIDREHAVKLPPHRYFICDILGCTVISTDKDELGIVEDIIQTGSNDVYVVKNEKKEILIPALKKVVKEISIDEKCIIIDASMLEEVTIDAD